MIGDLLDLLVVYLGIQLCSNIRAPLKSIKGEIMLIFSWVLHDVHLCMRIILREGELDAVFGRE